MQSIVNRRRFIKHLVVMGGASMLPMVLDGCHAGTAASGDGWVDAGPQTGVSAAAPLKVQAGKGIAYLTRNAGGAIIALSAKCTHRGCTVAWNPTASEYLCPCHGAKYDATGKNISGPAPSPLQTLQTKVDASGHVLVEPITT